jgi:uncharacterized phage protein (TIGR02220 family)
MSKNISKNFITIQGWMVEELDLNSNNLLVFALIYGFNQDEESEFTGSLNYICNWLNCSKPTASKALNDLVEKQLLIKRTKYINNITFNSYQINFTVVKKLYGGDKETLSGGSKETLPYIDNINNNKDNISKVVPTSGIDTNKFVEYFNSVADRKFKPNDKIKACLKKAIKTYTKEEIKKAIDNAHKDSYHLETNFKYLTPEYILRDKSLEMFINQKEKQNYSINQFLASN